MIPLKASLVFVLLALASASSHADPCEPIRARIEAQIRDAGVAVFSVTTVEVAASVSGEVVGSCDNGTKKIVYAKGVAPADPADPAAPAAPAGSPAGAVVPGAKPVLSRPSVAKPTPERGILTECRDGTVSMGGTCKP